MIENSASAETRRQAMYRPKAMRSTLVGTILVTSTAWLCVPTAWAAKAAQLQTTLDVSPNDGVAPPAPQTYSVSVSKTGGSSNVSYHVTVANTGNNTINQVVFTATATATGSVAQPVSGIAGYSAFVNLGVADPNCTQPASPAVNTVTCAIGQLQSGASREFFLIFRAPEAGATIEFAGVTDFSNGNSPNAPPADVTRLVTNSMVLLATGGNAVKTVLPPIGGNFFTGADTGGVPNSTNKFSTSVTVPSTTGANQTVTDNGIKHDSLPSYTCNNTAPGYFCYGLSSKIDIRDAKNGNKVFFNLVAPGQVVKIFLRQDASSITVKLPWPFINDVKIFYNPSGVVDGLGAVVPPCTGNLPQPDQPCVKSRTDHTVATGNPGDPDDTDGGDRDSDDTLTGYYEYEIWAVDNGVYSW
jgi:hypothetical protein